METLFQTVKRAVPVPEAAARYGLEAGPSGMARCPFHPDKTPSLKLYDDHYYCFGCHAHGDVIQLASGLLGLSPYAAARTLADAFGLPSPSGRPPKPSPCAEGVWRSVPDAGRPPARLQPDLAAAAALRKQAARCQRVLHAYLRLLRRWRTQYAPASASDVPDERWVEAMQMYDRIDRLTEDLLRCTPEQLARAVALLNADGKIDRLERRLKTQERTEQEVV